LFPAESCCIEYYGIGFALFRQETVQLHEALCVDCRSHLIGVQGLFQCALLPCYDSVGSFLVVDLEPEADAIKIKLVGPPS
jgi:hypothetical protein